MKRRKQKGFTILELVIVIAIIGVLTGIMIPVISNIVSKANEANDVILARNISTSLKVSSKPISSLNDIKEVVEEQYGEDSFANLTPRSASKGNHFWYNYEQGIVEVKTFDEIKEREDYHQFDGSFRSCIKEGYVFLDQQGSELASIATLLESIYSRRECDQLLEYFASQNDIASNFLANLSNTLIINENGCLRGSNYNEISNVYFTSDNVRLTKTTLFEFSENKIAFKSIDEESPLGGSGLNNKVINIKKTMFFGTDTLIFASTSLPILSVDVNNVTQLVDIFSSNSTNALIRINNDNNLYRIVDKTIVNSSNNQVVYSGLTGTVSDSVRNYQLPELYEATISKEVSTSNNTVTNSVNIENENVNATIPSGVKVTNNTLALTVTPKEASEANVVLGEFADQAIDVHIEGVSKDNDVPIIINLGAVLPDHLNSNNVKLYHVEDYEAIEMTRVYTLEELNSHNTYYYNYGTGEVTIAIKSFSEILLRSGTSVK